MDNPFVLGGIAVGVILVVLIVVNVVVANKRKKEVEELDKLFPEGNLSGEHAKIPVEKVRRTTMEREKRKKQRARIPRERPKEGETLPFEDQEIVVRSDPNATSAAANDNASSQGRRSGSGKTGNARTGAGRGRENLDQTFAVRTTTRKTRGDKEARPNEQEEGMDGTTGRRLFKKSLLQRGEDLAETKPRTLINPSMFSGDEEPK
ncbi:hypothetical protein [Staphylospora marina]|uniref:hypothetical protein n=1 Tax=Staphylospora marina TaxID=2490858 RepID=UPI000F5BD22D|nr:hypothetical protein [Staphylospora marina]